jgi:hypothetical protein
METNNEFVWTDKLVKEFAYNFLEEHEGVRGESNLEVFKKSKQPKKDYEIISFKHKSMGYMKWYDGTYHRSNSEYYNTSLRKVPENVEIISVKRLSDGEVFTVGDNTNQGIVTGFFIGWAGMEVHFGNEGGSIEGLKKVKKPLLTTQDKVDIYFMDKYYSVTDDWKIMFSNATQEINYASRTFSTKEAAEEYILFNKPCLSLNDLLDVWGDKSNIELYKTSPLFIDFKEVANHKINQ